MIGAVALLHIGDHFFPAFLAEIDIEIRHRDPLGIEEPLEQLSQTSTGRCR